MSKHALLSPSGAERWLNCPVSAKLSSCFTEERENEYTSAGTKAHALAEREIKKLVHQPLNEIDFEIEPDMHENIKFYINYITRQVDLDSSVVEVEKQVNLDWLNEEINIFGTADCIVLKDRKIDIFDLKYGIGHLVEDDSQLKLYALGVLGDYDADRITTHIFQPRRGHIQRKEYTKEELLGWFDNVALPAALRSLHQPFLAVSGPWCKFCAGCGYCREKKFFEEDFRIDTPLSKLSLEELRDEYLLLEKLDKRKKDLKEAIENELKTGQKIPGLVLKPSRGRRVWTDTESVEKLSHELGIKGEPLSPSKIEKKIGKKKFEELFSDYVEMKPGRETVQIEKFFQE